MLRLERMEVSGFKSFADRTSVEFPDGITAVVGPNGCGKSNVADALAWVLGEQSARALRGAKMEDVIFNGTQERQSGGMAEVALHLLARGQALSGGRTRVTITRRLYRSGESEYLIDGKRARLADVRDLLDEVRAGVRTYAIIDQAHVASFVTSKPKERRIFIEEAAGIASYKSRRRLAELKLEATQANMLRVDDILREVERQRRSLQRQAGLARRARRIDDELKGLRTFWFANRGRQLGRLSRDLSELAHVSRREAGHLEQERTRLAGLLHDCRRAQETAQKDREAEVTREHRLRLEQARQANESEAALARAAALEEEAGRQAGEGQQLAEERDRRQVDLENQRATVSEADQQLAEAERALRQARSEVESFQADAQRAQSEARRLEKAHYDQLQTRSDLAARLSAAREAAQREEQRAVEAQASGVRLEEALAEAKEALAAAETEYKKAGEEADRMVAAVQEARREEEQSGQSVEQARSEQARLEAELNKLAGEKAALDSLQVRLAGAEAARTVLEKARGGALNARSVIAEIVHVDREVEQAAEAFLAEALPTVVVDSDADVLAGTALGVRGRVSFLPLDRPGFGGDSDNPHQSLPDDLAGDPRVRGRLGARLRTAPEWNGVISSRLPDALLVEGLEAALELHRRFPQFNFLTPEGHAVRASGVVSLEGSGEARQDGLLARARRREELAHAVEERTAARDAAVERVNEARSAQAEAGQRRRLAEERLGEARRAVATARLAWDQAGREVNRVDRELALARTVFEAAVRGREEAKDRATAIEAQVSRAEMETDQARERLEAAREQARLAEEKVREASLGLGGLNAERSAQFERRAALARDLERLRRDVEDLSARSSRGTEAGQRAFEDARRLRDAASEAKAAVEDLGQKAETALINVALAGERLEQASQAVREAEARLSQADEELDGARARRESLALEAGRALSDFEHLVDSCRADLSAEPEQLSTEAPADVDPELLADSRQLTGRISELKERREKLGPVNLLAEQEFDELSARFEEINGQRQDLGRTIEELQASIRKMDRESKERFVEAFTEIRRHFKEQFAILFRGGKGDILLEDENNPLESGIEILCQPPGKKLQSVSLLSGGEKALAANAMLFSIFRFQPPPFCLLDEVDAPLDDANVNRFTDAVRSFVRDTQFILITHNKRTMEMADILYGVTMPEPGISRLVSMTLD